MTDQTPEARVAKARERAERTCVWSEGEVPRHVAEYLWDAVHDRHTLLAYIDTIAADLALAAAVRALPGGLSLHHPRVVGAGADYFVRDAWGHQWYANTPEAAIKAAREEGY